MSKVGKPRPNNNTESNGAVYNWIESNGALCHEETGASLDEKENGNDYGLRVTDVPAIFHEAYIETAYRRVGLSAWESCLSILHLNNETFNVWTHIVGVALFLMHCPGVVFQDRSPVREVLLYPLLCFSVGITATFLMSIGAHTFNNMSVRARKVCFFADYASIGFHTFTGGMSFYFYSRPVDTDWRLFNEPSLFLGVSGLMSVLSTFVICRAMYHESPNRSKIIAFTYAALWVFNTLPYTSRIILYPSQLNAASLYHYKRHCFLYAVGTGAYVVNFPERLMAGVFDIVGHSHQFMHIFIAMGAADEFTAVHLDMLERQRILEKFPGPNMYNCFVLFAFVLLGNIALVFWYSQKLFAQRKTEKKQ